MLAPIPLALKDRAVRSISVEDTGKTAALSASPEFMASTMEQLAAHGIVFSSDDL